MKRRALSALTLAALLALAAFALAPLLWMVSLSLMPAGEATALPPRLLPSAPTLAHYEALFARLPLARAFANSLLLASAASALGLVTNSLAGYAFAKLRFRGRDALARGLLAALVIPGQVAMLPLFLLLKELGLVNTYAGVLVPSLASIFGIFLVRQYVAGIPDALLDAARLDGASGWQQLRFVTLPLLLPTTSFVVLMTAIGSLQLFAEPYVMTQGGPGDATRSLVLLMYEQGFRWWNLGHAAALAFVLFALVALATALGRRLFGATPLGAERAA